MSFRARLTIFFVLIVVVPMVAIGVLMFSLINDSEQGKADARTDAEALARAVGSLRGKALSVRFAALATRAGLARATLSDASRMLVDVGDRTAIAPGSVIARDPPAGRSMTVMVSELTASQYARELSSPAVAVVVRDGRRILASTVTLPGSSSVPVAGNVTLHRKGYRAVSQTFPGFGRGRVTVTVLSALSATAASLGGSRAVAVVLIVAFLVLAFGFSLLASRALQGRLSGFLDAARRLGSGDFSSPIRVEGNDEFAALGAEFNSMSSELSRRLDELSLERVRLREAIRRIGHTFASSLDRPALLELALKTAVDAVQGSGGRISVRTSVDEPLAETGREDRWPASRTLSARRSGPRCRTAESGRRTPPRSAWQRSRSVRSNPVSANTA